MATTVLLDDHVQNKSFHLVFTDKEFVVIDTHWNDQDRLLVDLSDTVVFENRTRWSELSPMHYQLLITKNLSRLDALSDDEQMDENNETVKSLHFLITGLLKCLETNTGSNIDLMRIERIADDNITFTFSARVCLQIGNKSAKECRNNPFRIVVDNTK